eukprot:823902-Pyramimonas_sp.AAC.1
MMPVGSPACPPPLSEELLNRAFIVCLDIPQKSRSCNNSSVNTPSYSAASALADDYTYGYTRDKYYRLVFDHPFNLVRGRSPYVSDD